jgi:hypothetical protein
MSNGTQVASWPSIMLTTQQEWDRVLPVSPAVGGSAVVDARLYRLDRPGVIYREVHVTLRSCGILREGHRTSHRPYYADDGRASSSIVGAMACPGWLFG